jgi:hypothetical protein
LVRDAAIDAAGAGLTGMLEEAMAQPELAAEQQPKHKISLSQQIEEIDWELQRRSTEFPRLVSKGKLRQSEADYQTARLRAVRATLEWLIENEGFVKWAIANRDAIKQKMEEGDA